jgi:hypothetical protein
LVAFLEAGKIVQGAAERRLYGFKILESWFKHEVVNNKLSLCPICFRVHPSDQPVARMMLLSTGVLSSSASRSVNKRNFGP